MRKQYANLISIIFMKNIDLHSNSVGSISATMRSPSDVFGSLLDDTEEHFRLHTDITYSRERMSAGVPVRPLESSKLETAETSVRSTISPTIATTSSSSENSQGTPVTPSMEIGWPGPSGKSTVIDSKEFSRTAIESSESISNSQLLVRQDQCCPSFVMSKSGKARNQNACMVS